MNKISDDRKEDVLAKYEELQNIKNEIDNQIKDIEDTCDEKTLSKINETKDFLEETDEKTNRKLNKIKELSDSNKISKKTANKAAEKVINNAIKKYNKKNKNLSIYQKVLLALEEKVDIDPGRLIGLTDGIFSIVMTLLIFSISTPQVEKITSAANFTSFLSSMIPNIGITLVSFILLASFWVYHHEFLKIKKLNMPYLWINILFLGSISFIPFGTYLVGNYSQFFLANVTFGLNIMLTVLLFLIMYYYANKCGFLDKKVSEKEKKYVKHTLYMIMGTTIVVNLLDFNVNHNFIYLFFLVPIISTIRDVNYKLKDME